MSDATPLPNPSDRAMRAAVNLEVSLCLGLKTIGLAEFLDQFAMDSIDRITAERDAAILERDETHTNLNDRIADLGAEVDQATKTIGRIWKALGIETYLDANGKEISECVAELKAERDAARAALKLALGIARREWDFKGAHPHRQFVIREMEAALTSTEA